MEYELIDVYEMLTQLNADGFKAVIRYAETLTSAKEYRAEKRRDSYLKDYELMQELATEGRVVSFAHFKDYGHMFYSLVKANAARDSGAEKLLKWAKGEPPAKAAELLAKRM